MTEDGKELRRQSQQNSGLERGGGVRSMGYIPSIFLPTVCSLSSFALFLRKASLRQVERLGHL